MKNIYQTALDVQDASNMSGVINTLANEIMPAIREEQGYREQGTAYLSHHPVMLLFLDKLVSLTHVGYIHDMDMQIAHAYSACHEHIEAEQRTIDDRESPDPRDVMLAEGEARLVHNCKSAPCHVCGSPDGTGLPMSEAQS